MKVKTPFFKKILHPSDLKSTIKKPRSIAIIFIGLFITITSGILFSKNMSTFFQSSSGDNPVAYWKFDEGQGSTANDSVGNNTGTLGSGSTSPN